MKLAIGFGVAAAFFFLIGMGVREEEPIVMAFFFGMAAAVAYVVSLRARLSLLERGDSFESRVANLEQRLSLTEAELDTANVELQRLKAAQEFDRLLAERLPR